MLFSFTVDYVIMRVQINQDGLKLSVTHQLLVYVEDVNNLGGNVPIIKKKKQKSFSSC